MPDEPGQDLLTLEEEATIASVLAHGEHGAVVRALTRGSGLVAGYVRGGRSRRLRPVLQPGNRIAGAWRARVDEQLPALTAELVRSRALLAMSPFGAAALDWLTAVVAATLPERQAYPAVHDTLEATLCALEAGPELDAAAAVACFELLLLAELGFGLDLGRCAATGAPAAETELTHVSPRSGGAVSAAAAAPWADRLLPLPAFLIGRGAPSWTSAVAALRLTGFFLERDLLEGRARLPLSARERLASLIDRRAIREPAAQP